MQLFDPRSIAVSCSHFIDGLVVRDTPRMNAVRPSDGQVQCELPLADAREVGGHLRCGGHLFDGGPGGAYFIPTRIEGVTAASPAVQEEIFGPVLTVQTFDTEEEGLVLAAHPHYGLAAGVHTANIGRAMRGLSAGTVWINRYGRSADFVVPTGGYHQSGIGKDLGRQAVEANLRLKSVLTDFTEVH